MGVSGFRAAVSPGDGTSPGCGRCGAPAGGRGRKEANVAAMPTVLHGSNSAKISAPSLRILRSSAAKDEPWTRWGWESLVSITVGICTPVHRVEGVRFSLQDSFPGIASEGPQTIQ